VDTEIQGCSNEFEDSGVINGPHNAQERFCYGATSCWNIVSIGGGDSDLLK